MYDLNSQYSKVVRPFIFRFLDLDLPLIFRSIPVKLLLAAEQTVIVVVVAAAAVLLAAVVTAAAAAVVAAVAVENKVLLTSVRVSKIK